jgi:hypothetical protein
MKIEATTSPPVTVDHKNTSSDKTSSGEKPSDAASFAQKQDNLKKIQNLERIQQLVLTHELSHKAGGANVTGGVTYRYKRGPDGQVYIAGGDTSVRVTITGNCKDTIEQMEEVGRAATSPANPSFVDFVVLAYATACKQQAMLMQAQEDFNKRKLPDPL